MADKQEFPMELLSVGEGAPEGAILTPSERAALRSMLSEYRRRHPIEEDGDMRNMPLTEQQLEALASMADFWTSFQRVGIAMAAVRSAATLIAFFAMAWIFFKAQIVAYIHENVKP